MRNCVILGSGRSGTSMVAGSLSKAGYFMGDNLLGANSGNPKGLFEDQDVIDINEKLLAQVLPARPRFIGRFIFRKRPAYGQRALARLPVGAAIPTPPNLAERIQQLTRREPHCFKDPRLSYTLPVWRRFLKPDTAFVCVFRDPASTALSFLKARRLHRLPINFKDGVDVWTLMNRHILEIHRKNGDWLFLHYNQVLAGDGLSQLASFLDAPVDLQFPDPDLRRSGSDREIPHDAAETYEQLCELANYRERVEVPAA